MWTLRLPLLPLNTGVVLPQMVVTLALETRRGAVTPPTAPSPATAASCSCRASAPATPASAPSPGSRTRASCPAGSGPWCSAACPGPSSGRTVPSDQPGVWVEAEPVAEPAAVTGRAKEMVREYRAVVRGIAEKLGTPAHRRRARRRRRPRRAGRHRRLVARPVGRAQGRAAGDDRRRGAPGEGVGLGARDAGRARAVGADPQPRDRRHGQDAARVPAAPADAAIRKELGETATPTTSSPSTAPSSPSWCCPTTCAAAIEREVDQLRAHERAEPRARVDPHVARHRARDAVGRRAPRSTLDVARRARDPRRRPHRPRRREGPHRRVPGGAQAARRARHERQRRAHQGSAGRGRDPRAGRSSRRRQDVAG